MKITFVRHTSVDVDKGICYGQTDVPLRPSAPEEGEKVRDFLRGKPFDAVYTSPLSRCRWLADFCGCPDALRDPRIMEINFGEWEMKSFDDIAGPEIERWYADYENVAAPGGESFREQRERVKAFMDDLRASGKENILVFTHGGVIIQAMIIAGLVEWNKSFDTLPEYGGIREIEY